MLSTFFISSVGTMPHSVLSGCYAGNLYLSFLDLIWFYWEKIILKVPGLFALLFFWFFLIFTIYIYYFPSSHKINFVVCCKYTLKTSVLIGFWKKIIFNCSVCLTVELNHPWESELNVCFRVQNKYKWREKKKPTKQTHLNYN